MRWSRLHQHEGGALDELLHLCEEVGSYRSVHDAVVAGESEVEAQAGLDFVIHHDGLLDDVAHRKNGCLRGVDDGVERVDAIGSQVGDGDGAAIEFIGLQFLFACACGEVFDLAGNLKEGLGLRIFDHGGDQAIVDRDCDRDADGGILNDVVAGVRGVHFWNSDAGIDERLHDEIVDGILVASGLFGLLIDLLAQAHEGSGIDLDVEVEVGDGELGSQEALGNDLAHAGELDALVFSGGHGIDCLARGGGAATTTTTTTGGGCGLAAAR